MWYYELFCGDRFLHKSIMFETKEEAVEQAVNEAAELKKQDQDGEYAYEFYCTCELEVY